MDLHRLLLEALQFENPRPEQLQPLTDAEWQRLLAIADEEHLTLALALRCAPVLPPTIRSRTDSDLAKNARRFAFLQEAYKEIASAFEARGVSWVVLKGFSHWPRFSLDPRHRPQYDLDLLCRPHQLTQAKDALVALGYEPIAGFDEVPLDHLPAMIRRTGWQWRGDYFDVELPFAVELHFRFWDAETEHIDIHGVQEFWGRQSHTCIDSFCFPALHAVDRAAYAALHLVRHVLRGDFRLYHAYELAHLLDESADDRAFWSQWMSTHSESLRTIQAIGFRFAGSWFKCRVPVEVLEECGRAPESAQQWFQLFAMAPIEAKRRPNKNELWLHLSLIQTAVERREVLRRRLLPVLPKRTMHAAHLPSSGITWRIRLARVVFQFRFTFLRFLYHLRSMAPTLFGGAKWWWVERGIDPQLFRFLGAVSIFNFGVSIFFLLYNLFLLQLRFQEDFIGRISSAMSVGSIVGTLPGAFVLHKLGIRTTLVLILAGLPTVCVIRALASVPAALLVSAFLGGAFFSLYAVSIAPTVAQFTTTRSRPLGFSLFFSLGIAIGVLAGLVGGKLPGWMSLQNALFAACGIAALSTLPALKLEVRSKPESERRIYPRGPFIKQFLAVLLLWSLATGAFNPFFSVYFSSNLGMPVDRIGVVYSAAQMAQVVALLLAPLVLRRLGPISGLMGMQLATAVMLAALAIGPNGVVAAFVYALYVAFQYMSEPGMYTLLMERVQPQEQSGASALNFLVIFGGQALAASIAGIGVRRFGYAAVLSVAALAAVLAAISLRQIRSSTSMTS